MSAARYAEPIPKATTAAVFAAGRAIKGSTGMSLASTVSRVMEDPVTQRCLLPFASTPPWTDAISSSAVRRMVPPLRSIRATVGSTNAWPPATATTSRPMTTVPLPAIAARTAGRPSPPHSARTIARPAFTIATRASASGEPIRGITTNGMRNVPAMAPIVFEARSRPARPPTSRSDPATSADAAGKLRPMTKVAGRTTRALVRRNASKRPLAGPCMSRIPVDAPGITSTAPRTTSTAVPSWASASSPTVFRIQGRTRVKAIAPRAIPIRNRARIIVNT